MFLFMLGINIRVSVRWPAFIQNERAVAISKSSEPDPAWGRPGRQKGATR